MSRFLDICQGLIALVFIVLAAVAGWPVLVIFIAVLAQLAITVIIVIVLRDESPKGRAREGIETIILLVLGLGGLIVWLSSNGEASLLSPSPIWMAIVGVPSVLMNLGYYVALILTLGVRILEFTSGESVSDFSLGGGGGGSSFSSPSYEGAGGETSPPE